jgi:hypothetical protein
LNILNDAKKKITDALMFTSWVSLLDHPRAKEALNGFRIQASDYQTQIDEYEVYFRIKIIDETRFVDYIKLSSESTAMNSFNRLTSQLTDIIDITEKKIVETGRQSRTAMDEVRILLFQF